MKTQKNLRAKILEMPSYNATLWRIRPDGSVLSVQVGEVQNGKVLRSSGHWCAANGTEAYHTGFMAEASTFGDERIRVVATMSPDHMIRALRGGHQATFTSLAPEALELRA